MKQQERAVIEALANRRSANQEEGAGQSDATLIVDGKRVTLQIAAIKGLRVAGRGRQSRARLRLRFDKVVVRLIERLRATFREGMPGNVTVLLTISAPIRLPSKTADALEDKIRVLLARRDARTETSGTIHGNQIRLRRETFASSPAKIIGFVHNAVTDPRMLLDMTRSLAELLSEQADAVSAKESSEDRWLVVKDAGTRSHVDAYRYIYSELRIPTRFKKILMMSGDGRVETLS